MEQQPESSAPAPLPPRPTILIVEPDASVRALLRGVLEREGYQVLDAKHPARALLHLRSGRVPIHLLLTELELRDMGGKELSDWTLTQGRRLPTLYTSAWPDPSLALDPLEAFLTKPYTLSELLRRVKELLEAGHGAAFSEAGRRAPADVATHPHCATIYGETPELARSVAAHLLPGMADDTAVAVIARPEHWGWISRAFDSSGTDPAILQRQGRLQVVDARAGLKGIMRGGSVDLSRFQEFADQIFKGGPSRKSWAVYGEMADLLWQSEEPESAIMLEDCWKDFVGSHDCRMLCGYHLTTQELAGTGFTRVAQAHSYAVLI
ncbi:MAG TPA: MEDS domain-containing protein [Planctomycetota bacterium]|nr:MEDS domain-containing protein [Planctomycetota bacterium]